MPLITQDLCRDLDTAYFNARSGLQKELLHRLDANPDQEFKLQQLLFDLDKAEVKDFQGFPKDKIDRGVWAALNRHVLDMYVASVDKVGQPIAAVTAISSSANSPSLQLTRVK